SPGFPIRVTFSADGQHALVTNARAATLGVFSVRHRRPVALVPLAETGVEYRETMLGRAALPIGAVADPDGRRVYVAISGGNQIAVVDTGKWKVVERWATSDEPDALAIVPPAPTHAVHWARAAPGAIPPPGAIPFPGWHGPSPRPRSARRPALLLFRKPKRVAARAPRCRPVPGMAWAVATAPQRQEASASALSKAQKRGGPRPPVPSRPRE